MRTHTGRLRARRHRSFGVSAVEFALVAPVFFASLFGAIDGGLLLFSANAINHSVGLGVITVAQEGNTATTDTDAILAIRTQGFGAAGFAKVDEIDIFKTTVNPSTGSVSQDMTPNCTGGVACLNRYNLSGALLNPAAGGAPPWDPTTRQTSLSSLANVGITIRSHYNYLAFSAAQMTLNFTRYFQLEPQS
ncbi:MAG: pilus assembly protein [Candidatus Dormibacteraeota bacterium]|uniref:Pilus assembly protein n=1 Tax=Candidatus Amunia macphersoniae TaxID=3127014 RepID=A0A934KKQ8_9BACT|nr:pilus assembly protein [Candidatus Dormibacteraeota bacterium]